jgi:hypothetical protein
VLHRKKARLSYEQIIKKSEELADDADDVWDGLFADAFTCAKEKAAAQQEEVRDDEEDEEEAILVGQRKLSLSTALYLLRPVLIGVFTVVGILICFFLGLGVVRQVLNRMTTLAFG